ncbi:hypothetical protein PO883_14855 [Massilia sp. DJPM01]|uniref:hypothetical protein n=1 Tax=Massilia sp. DJPM01 TaxID=3024404 RepID=UPI00259E4A93|nr:hypothetical protein [Massilia sp. DJPM01]MDM5178477.1 hypothetical protein [Massilia sp. DJPM01]
MNSTASLLLSASFLSLCGCATDLVLPKDAAPSSAAAYVGGNFTLLRNTRAIAFILKNQDTAQEFPIPFTSKANYRDGHNEVALVPLPPGRYAATHWVLYNAYYGPTLLGGGQELKRRMDESILTQIFVLHPGEVVFLGKFVGIGAWVPGVASSTTSAQWTAEKLTKEQAQGDVRDNYRNFGHVNVRCIACDR